jgi:uncharacterized protein (UPF0332 family)
VPPDPERLFQQAEALVARAHQEDLRRAISAAYYGLFHFILTAAADKAVGANNRTTPQYSVVYRTVDHSHLRGLGIKLSGTSPQGVALVPSDGFGLVAKFARIAANLYEQRNSADYDPAVTFTPDAAKLSIDQARQAIRWFQQGTAEQQETFLTLLLYKPRG